MQTNTVPIMTAIVIGIVTLLVPPAAFAAGASSDFGKTYCSYLKTRAMAAKDTKSRKALMAKYRRCLKEHGEG